MVKSVLVVPLVYMRSTPCQIPRTMYLSFSAPGTLTRRAR